MGGKMAPTQNPSGSILNPSTLEGLGADPLGGRYQHPKIKTGIVQN